MRCVQLLRKRRLPVYLAVLKRLGRNFGGPLSFPLEGWTLAIDLPAAAPGLMQALDELDEIVAGCGGRVYLTKDARMRPRHWRSCIPNSTVSTRSERRSIQPACCARTSRGAWACARRPKMSRRRRRSAGKRVVVLGGTSEIARAIVGELNALEPREVALVGRDPDALRVADRYLTDDGCPRVLNFELDAHDLDRHEKVIGEAFDELGGADIVVLAVGVLGERGGLPEDMPLPWTCSTSTSWVQARCCIHAPGVCANRARARSSYSPRSPASEHGGQRRLRRLQGWARRPSARTRRRAARRRRACSGGAPWVCAYPHDHGTGPSAAVKHSIRGRPSHRRRTRPPLTHRVGAPALRWAMLAVRLLPRPLFQRLKQ